MADNGADAVRRAGNPAQPVDLLLTDVIMPEMLGHEVAARVAALRPETPVLFISGYAQPILDAQGVLLPGYDILEKPFTGSGAAEPGAKGPGRQAVNADAQPRSLQAAAAAAVTQIAKARPDLDILCLLPRPVAGLTIRWSNLLPGIRTLALLTRSLGAKLGASYHRHRATPGHIQPLSLQLGGAPGHAQHRPGTLRKCLLSSRSRVRVAVGAQVRALNSITPSALREAAGSQRAVTAASEAGRLTLCLRSVICFGAWLGAGRSHRRSGLSL